MSSICMRQQCHICLKSKLMREVSKSVRPQWPQSSNINIENNKFQCSDLFSDLWLAAVELQCSGINIMLREAFLVVSALAGAYGEKIMKFTLCLSLWLSWHLWAGTPHDWNISGFLGMGDRCVPVPSHLCAIAYDDDGCKVWQRIEGKSRALWEAFQIQLAHVFRNDMKYDLMPQ